MDEWLATLPPSRGIFAAGGDGTAVAVVNALARVLADKQTLPPVGVLPLGTGNGWAHALGAPKLHRCLALLATAPDPLPTRASALVEVEGVLAHFAGSGWDAMILEDYRRQIESVQGPGKRFSRTVYAYLWAALSRTTPKVALHGNPRVLIENVGDHIYAIDAACRPRRLSPDTCRILYDGEAGAASVGTCPEFGYRFHAFPFAERIPGCMSVRVYAKGAIGAALAIPSLWRGSPGLPGMHDWLATHVRMTFSRPVPLQIGGDFYGERRTVEYRVSPRVLPMVDWRRIESAALFRDPA
jgi:diacylglycerol kinase family enzyme